MGLPPEAMERLKLTQEGMAQFELLHAPTRAPSTINGSEMELVVCRTCHADFPCPRMTTMLIVQGLAQLTTMLPTGNVANLLGRFAKQ